MLNETIAAGLNNPECSFYVGAFLGQAMFGKLLIYAGVIYIIVKSLDKLAIEPFIAWVKKKFFKSDGGTE